MSHRGQESPGYMDGICVKISERYKPPPRINLAISYSQRLSLNKQIQDNILGYDFSLETNVKDRIKDLKNARKLIHEEKKNRLEKLKEARRKYEDETKQLNESKNLNTTSDEENKTFISTASGGIFPTYSTYSHILTPTPLTSVGTSKSYTCDRVDKSPFNISDFEADTSSPFDNMELKTINDLEELAQVLKKDDSHNVPYSVNQIYSNYVPPIPSISTQSNIHSSYNFNSTTPQNYVPYNISHTVTTYGHTVPTTTMYNHVNGYYYTPEVLQANSNFSPYKYSNFQTSDNSPPQTKQEETSGTSFKSVPNIMKELQAELHNTHIHNTKIENYTQNEIARPKKSDNVLKEQNKEVDDTFELLPINLQHLSKNISLMGFPLSRVARACQVLGDDHKKIVEHLLAMSELLDLGFSEKDVSNALLQCNNDRDKALDILIS